MYWDLDNLILSKFVSVYCLVSFSCVIQRSLGLEFLGVHLLYDVHSHGEPFHQSLGHIIGK